MHTEDARRIILRAANAGPRSPQKGNKNNSGGSQAPHIINIAGSRVSASANASSSTVANAVAVSPLGPEGAAIVTAGIEGYV